MGGNPSIGDLESTWSGMSSPVGGQTLEFSPRVVTQSVQACITAIESLMGLKKNLSLLQISNKAPGQGTPALGDLPHYSGDRLETALNKKGPELGSALDAHIKTLTKMGDTFISAGQAYESAEHMSSYDFSTLSRQLNNPTASPLMPVAAATVPNPLDPSTPFAPPPNQPIPVAAPTAVPTSKPVTPEYVPNPIQDLQSRGDQSTTYSPNSAAPGFGMGISYDSVTPLADQANNLLPQDLVQLGRTIDWQTVAIVAENWDRFYQQLSNTFNDLRKGLSSALDSGEWTGDGRDKAANAVNDYLTNGYMLTNRTSEIASNLWYTQDWLNQAKAAMPTSPYSSTSGSNGRTPMSPKELQAFRTKYQYTYADGYEQSRQNIATFDTPPSNNNSNNKNNQTTNQNQNGGNNGNNNGGTNSGNNGAANNGSSSGASSHSGSGSGTHSGSGFGAASHSAFGSGSGVGSRSGLGSGSGVGTGSGAVVSGASTAAQQQAQAAQALQQGVQTGMQALQQALQAGQQLAQQALAAGQQAAAQNALSALNPSGMAGLADRAAAQFGGAAAGSIGSGMGAGAGQALGDYAGQSRLFPRASSIGPTATGSPGVASPGVAAGGTSPGGVPMGGSPMGGMGGAGQSKDNEKAHKRAKYLDSTSYLDEAFGAAPDMARPTVGAADPATEQQAQSVDQPVTARTAEGESQERPVSSRKTKVRVHRPDPGQGQQVTV